MYVLIYICSYAYVQYKRNKNIFFPRRDSILFKSYIDIAYTINITYCCVWNKTYSGCDPQYLHAGLRPVAAEGLRNPSHSWHKHQLQEN